MTISVEMRAPIIPEMNQGDMTRLDKDGKLM